MPFLSTKEIAAELGIKADTVSVFIKKYGMPFHKVGNHNKFDLEEVKAWSRARAEQSLEQRNPRAAIIKKRQY